MLYNRQSKKISLTIFKYWDFRKAVLHKVQFFFCKTQNRNKLGFNSMLQSKLKKLKQLGREANHIRRYIRHYTPK